MALIFIEGFDVYSTPMTELYPGKWNNGSISGFAGLTTGRLGVNKCLSLTHSDYVDKTLNNIGPIIVGLALKFSSSPAGETFLEFYEGGITNFTVQLNTSRKIEVTNSAGSIVGTSTLALSVGVWYYIEVKATIGNTGSVEVRVDSNTEINVTSIDIMNSSNAYVDNMRLLGNTASLYIDDLYLLDTTGSINNDFLGDSRVDPFFPSADNTVQWLPSSGVTNYTNVDDATPNGDTDYVYSSTPGDIDLYDFGNMPIGTGDVFGVQVVANARKMDAGTRNLKIKVKSGATTQTSGTLNLSTTYANHIAMFEDSDGAGTVWDKTLVDAAQIGIEVV
jgi:hypothetical protein